MTEPGEAEVATVIAEHRGRAELGRADELALRRHARNDLLELDALPDAMAPSTEAPGTT